MLRLSTRYEGESENDLRPLDETTRAAIKGLYESLGRDGFRVLGIAWHPVAAITLMPW